MKTFRVLIVIGTLQIGGGAERVAARVGSELSKRGHDVHLVTFYEADEKYAFAGTYHSFAESPKRSRLYKVWGIPVRLWRIRQYIKRQQPDTVISFLEEANFYALFAKWLFRLSPKVVVSVRNNVLHRGRVFHVLMRWLYPKAVSVVSVTRAVEQILRNSFGIRNTTTIYNPIDATVVAEQSQQALPQQFRWLQTASPLVVSIGRLIHQKGQWHLVRTFTQVVEKYPTAQLVIVGGGEYKGKLQTLIDDCGVKGHVHLVGTHKNVYPFLAAADVFAFSSLFEGMPNTLLEAYSVGLPIVTTDCVSGPREIIAPELSVSETVVYPYYSEHGVLLEPLSDVECWENSKDVPLQDSEAMLGEQICRQLQDSKSRQYATDDRFNLEHITDQWQALL